MRLSKVSGYSVVDGTIADNDIRVSYVGTYENEKKPKVTL